MYISYVFNMVDRRLAVKSIFNPSKTWCLFDLVIKIFSFTINHYLSFIFHLEAVILSPPKQ